MIFDIQEYSVGNKSVSINNIKLMTGSRKPVSINVEQEGNFGGELIFSAMSPPDWDSKYLSNYRTLQNIMWKTGYKYAIQGIEELYKNIQIPMFFQHIWEIFQSLGWYPDKEYKASTHPFRGNKDIQEFLHERGFIIKINTKPLTYKLTDKGKNLALIFNKCNEMIPFYDSPHKVAVDNEVERPVLWRVFPDKVALTLRKHGEMSYRVSGAGDNMVERVPFVRFKSPFFNKGLYEDEKENDIIAFLNSLKKQSVKVDMDLSPAGIMPTRDKYIYNALTPDKKPVIIQLDSHVLDSFYVDYGEGIKLRMNHNDIDSENTSNAVGYISENLVPVFIYDKDEKLIGYMNGGTGLIDSEFPYMRHRHKGISILKSFQESIGVKSIP